MQTAITFLAEDNGMAGNMKLLLALLITFTMLLMVPACSAQAASASEQARYGSGSETETATHPDMQWERLLHAAPWGKRAMPRGGLLDGQFYILGGRAGMFRIYSDTWRSPDGVRWELMNADAPWGVRAGHHTMVIDDDIYLFAGGVNTFGRILYNDLWVSTDQGATWELRAELPEDMGRAGMQVVEIDGTIYFMGGDHDDPVIAANWPGRRNDVWAADIPEDLL